MKSLIGFVAALAREVWAMEPGRLEAFFARLSSLEPNAHVGPATGQFASRGRQDLDIRAEDNGPSAGLFDDAPPRSRMAVANGVATIPISGVLMKSVPKIFRWFGIDATSYQEIQDDLAKANGDAGVSSILLAIDSPGGQVAGVKETADAIAASSKPVSAQITDLGASAAYWLASQARQISALPNALVGSIGVYSAYTDSSKAAEDLGIKVHVVSSGPHKGMGVPGAKITAEQLAAAQEVIDGMAANFVADVARGRRRETKDAQSWATGRVWLAKESKAMGLIDQVATSETPKGAAGGRPAAELVTQESKEETMTDQEKKALEEKAAKDAVAADRKRAQDIKAAFPEDPTFALEQVESGASLVEAKAAYSDVLRDRAKAAELDGRKPKVAAPASAAVGGGKAEEQGGGQDFMALVEAHMKKTGCTKLQAMSAMCKQHPEAYRAFDLRLAAK